MEKILTSIILALYLMGGVSISAMQIVHLRMAELGNTPMEKIALNCMANLLIGESGYNNWFAEENVYAMASGVISYLNGDFDKWLDNALLSAGTCLVLHTIAQPFYDTFGDPIITMDAGKTRALSQFMLFSYMVKI